MRRLRLPGALAARRTFRKSGTGFATRLRATIKMSIFLAANLIPLCRKMRQSGSPWIILPSN
jgi:hypothetical protein